MLYLIKISKKFKSNKIKTEIKRKIQNSKMRKNTKKH